MFLAERKGEGMLIRGRIYERGMANRRYILLVRKNVSRLRKIL
jgi:hypothetical protein